MSVFSNYINKRKKYKELVKYEKEREKEQEKLEKEAEEEVKTEEAKERKEKGNKNYILELFDLIDDEELVKEENKYLTEAEKEEIKQNKINNKKFTHRVIFIIVIFFIIVLIGCYFIIDANKSTLKKESLPIIKDYYYNKFGEKDSFSNLQYLCYKELDENNKRVEKCSNIVYGTSKSGITVMSVDNNLLGDDGSSASIKNDYNIYLHDNMSEYELLYSNPEFSYQDYYLNFNRYYSYIHTLPNGYDFNSLLDSNKLTIIDTIAYQGNINTDFIKNLLNKLSDSSRFIFVKFSNSYPVEFTYISKSEYYDMSINNQATDVYDGVKYYEFDRNISGVSSVKVNKVSDNSVDPLDSDYEIVNCFDIDYDGIYNYNNKDIVYPYYYMLSFDNLNSDVIEFDSNEYEADEYKDIYVFSLNSKTYVIANSNNLGIGNKIKKSKGFFDNK